MSLEIKTFVPTIDNSMIPDWIENMNRLGMHCEIFPGFSFKDHAGFLPFRVNLEHATQNNIANVDYLTGFEFYINNFSLKNEIDLITPKPTVLDKLIRKTPKPVYFATPEIDQKLAACMKVLSFVWGNDDTLELRMATLSGLILAKIANGISLYPADSIWYTDGGAIEKALKEIEEFEASLKPDQLKLHKFETWLL